MRAAPPCQADTLFLANSKGATAHSQELAAKRRENTLQGHCSCLLEAPSRAWVVRLPQAAGRHSHPMPSESHPGCGMKKKSQTKKQRTRAESHRLALFVTVAASRTVCDNRHLQSCKRVQGMKRCSVRVELLKSL